VNSCDPTGRQKDLVATDFLIKEEARTIIKADAQDKDALSFE